MVHQSSNILTNQAVLSEMNIITQRTAKYISDRFYGNFKLIDLTWFNLYDKSINFIEEDYVVALDVADPPYFLREKLEWVKSVRKPIVFVGPPNNHFNIVVPFFAWQRFRPQVFTPKLDYDNFFVSFNRKPHPHRQFYFKILNSFEFKDNGLVSYHSKKPIHKINSLDLDNDIVELQRLAQIIDDKQLSSLFEIVCETSPSNSHIFLTEKFNKCLASETPLFLAGNRNSLTVLKNYYGFYPFGPDDSYDTLPTFRERVIKMLTIADSFFSHPSKSVFDSAKKNAYHLFNDFDSIHDNIADRHIEKSMKHVKNCIANGVTFKNRI